MVQLRRALERELKRHVLAHLEAIAPTLRQDEKKVAYSVDPKYREKVKALNETDRGVARHKIVNIPLDEILTEGAWSESKLAQAKRALQSGMKLDPVRVEKTEEGYAIDDGNHRVAAAKALGHTHIPAHVSSSVKAPAEGAASADQFSQRFANFEVSVGRLTDEAALGNRLKEIAQGVQEHARGELARIHTAPFTPRMESQSREFVQENVRLIKKMTREQTSRIRDIVIENVQAQTSYQELRSQIEEQFGLTKARSELIAVDQTLKHNASITEELHKQAGVTKYVWNTSHDERVRGTPGGKWPKGEHYNLDGKVFEYSSPPVVDKRTGRRANPGHDYRCRCTAIPYTDDLLYGE